MSKVLILFAHPALEKSRVNAALAKAVCRIPGVTFNDLYERYPDFNIDVQREQALLEAHDVVILQHPFYWYSTPALVKQWEDVVLEHGWAYGSTGNALEGKRMLSAVTAGGSRLTYQTEGVHCSTIRNFLLPIERTAALCGMIYLPPYVTFGTHLMEDADIDAAADHYAQVVQALCEDRLEINLDSCAPLLSDNPGIPKKELVQ